jgi:hypothetical protein
VAFVDMIGAAELMHSTKAHLECSQPTGCRACNWRAIKALIISMARSVCGPG